MRITLALFAALLVGCSGSEEAASGAPGSGGADPPAGAASSNAPAGSSPSPNASDADASSETTAVDAGVDAAIDAAPADPCPNLPIPKTLFNRHVVYREWGLSATGDGTYFAGQAPLRLGFNRVQNTLWLVKIRTDANTYFGRVGGYGDNGAGITWISDRPDDVSFAVQHGSVAYSTHGGGMINFAVVDSPAAAQKIATDPAYATYRLMPQLEADHCYYVGFENVAGYPQKNLDASFWSSADDCGANGDGTCYYLAFDFFHYLDSPITGTRMGGSVIAGLTH